MTFVSSQFALLLACTLPTYYLLGLRARQFLLLAASYVFYAYWNPAYAWLILASTVVDYLAARIMDRDGRTRLRKIALAASLGTNLGMLGYFKYTNFALDSLHALLPFARSLPAALDIALPVGISFYTFQTLSYSIDVYRRERPAERDFWVFALFVGFFPQLMAGPIERASDLLPQLKEKHRFQWHNIELGGARILWGLIKKSVFADRIGSATLPFITDPARATSAELVYAGCGVFVMLYLDFSAYTDLARGIAQLFGVRLSKNFDFPLAASNVSAYWRRWHITLSAWLQDYVARPLHKSRPTSLVRRGMVAILITGLIGLWHGAQWTFIVWGIANGATIAAYLWLRHHVLCHVDEAVRSSAAWAFVSWMTSTAIRVLMIALFFAPNFAVAVLFYRRLFGDFALSDFADKFVVSGLGLVCAFFVFHYLQCRFGLGDWFRRWPSSARGSAYTAGSMFVMFLAKPTSEAFVYFQF